MIKQGQILCRNQVLRMRFFKSVELEFSCMASHLYKVSLSQFIGDLGHSAPLVIIHKLMTINMSHYKMVAYVARGSRFDVVQNLM